MQAPEITQLSDMQLINELRRRGKVVSVWSAADFESQVLEDKDVDDSVPDDKLKAIQAACLEEVRPILDEALTNRGIEFCYDWWNKNRSRMLSKAGVL